MHTIVTLDEALKRLGETRDVWCGAQFLRKLTESLLFTLLVLCLQAITLHVEALKRLEKKSDVKLSSVEVCEVKNNIGVCYRFVCVCVCVCVCVYV